MNSRFSSYWIAMLLPCLAFSQEKGEMLFSIGEKKIYKKDVEEMLPPTSAGKQELSVEDFNRILNFYLNIHDIKQRKEDTTQLFRRKLDGYWLKTLGTIYGSKNHEKILDKCMLDVDSFPIVRDLFVPFDPILIKEIREKIEKENVSIEQLADYAATYEGTQFSKRLILPTNTEWAINNVVCDILAGDTHILGPLKDAKGYHYIQLLDKIANFGRYKTKVIFIPDPEKERETDAKSAAEALAKGESFDAVAVKYSKMASENEGKAPIVHFAPSITMNKAVIKHLSLLKKNGDISLPFYSKGGWYIIKRLSKVSYPDGEELKVAALKNTRKPSFFIEELRRKYKVVEYPCHFLLGDNEVLFVVNLHSHHVSDLRKFAEEYGYDYTIDTYDKFFIHALLDEYKRELDAGRYEKLLESFYFFQGRLKKVYRRSVDKELFYNDLRELVKEYKPVISNKNYEKNNPVFN